MKISGDTEPVVPTNPNLLHATLAGNADKSPNLLHAQLQSAYLSLSLVLGQLGSLLPLLELAASAVGM